MKKLLSIVGARPQFIKAAVVSKELRKGFDEVLVHTGQHYDDNMSKIFFDDMGIPKPDYNLGVAIEDPKEQINEMRIQIKKIIDKEKPDLVIVYGDTNSTKAGAMAASELGIPLAHVEAGLRSFDMSMPEEENRIFTDKCSKLLFCPTETAVDNLKKEGIIEGVHNTGDVMYDATLYFLEVAEEKSNILDKLGLNSKDYLLATVHRQSNTDDKHNLKSIFDAFVESGEKIVLPLHPRTKKMLSKYGLYEHYSGSNIIFIDPVGYLDMLILEKNAKKILTDSGGIQKEAYFMKVPCITLRDNTEWVETVDNKWNVLVGADSGIIFDAIKKFNPLEKQGSYYGSGSASNKTVKIIESFFKIMEDSK